MYNLLKTWLCLLPGSVVLSFVHPATDLASFGLNILIMLLLFLGGSKPIHDEFSHGADAFRMLGQVADKITNDEWGQPIAYSNTGIV